MNTPPIPERMKGRPVWKGLAVPYTASYVGPNPDLKLAHEPRREECLYKRLCGLCGGPLSRVICFIGGPVEIESRIFFDPGMHEECALYATKACPYLANPNAKYSKDLPILKKIVGDVKVHDYSMKDLTRPERLGVYYCLGYRVIKYKSQPHPLAANNPIKIDWDQMPRSTRRGEQPTTQGD